MNTKRLLAFAIVVFDVSSTQGAVLVNWDFSGLDWRTGNGSGLGLNDLAPRPILTSASANAAAGISASDLTPSPALRVVVNATTAAGEADVRDFDAGGNGTNDEYMEFAITGNAAGSVNIDSISISQWRNGGGAVDGMAFEVNIDGGGYSLYDAVQIDPNSGGGPSFDVFTFNEAIVGADTVGIRFAPRTVNQGSTGNLHINNIQVSGTVVPEPGSLALLGLGGIAFLRRRRA